MSPVTPSTVAIAFLIASQHGWQQLWNWSVPSVGLHRVPHELLLFDRTAGPLPGIKTALQGMSIPESLFAEL